MLLPQARSLTWYEAMDAAGPADLNEQNRDKIQSYPIENQSLDWIR